MKFRSALAFPLLVLCTNCSAPEEAAAPRPIGQLGQAFSAGARQADIAEPLLYAIAEIEDGFDEPMRRRADPEAEAPQAGPFHLRHGAFDSLGAAARAEGVTELALREDTALATRAGAKLLSDVLARHGARVSRATDPTGAGIDWSAVKEGLAEWSGYFDRWHQVDYATRVLGALARGGRVENRYGESLGFAPIAVPPALLLGEPKPVALTALVAEFEGAELFPINPDRTGKYLVGRDGYSVDTLIIHDTEGGWEGSVATFQNEGGTSTHYLIGKDARVAQFLSEADTAYHCGNRIYNRRSVGIEHVGFADQPFPEALYAKSAILVGQLAAKYAVPADRFHIIGHDQVPSSIQPDYVAVDGPPCMKSPKECQDIWYYGGASGHTDPGIWQWGPYMDRMNASAKCNDLPTKMTCDSTGNYVMGCIEGEVRVHRCEDGCQPAGDGGAEPICELAPEIPPDPGPSDAGIVPTEKPDPVPPPQEPPPSKTGQLEDPLEHYQPAAPPPAAPPQDQAGCAIRRGADAPSHGSFALLLAAMLGARRFGALSRGRSARR